MYLYLQVLATLSEPPCRWQVLEPYGRLVRASKMKIETGTTRHCWFKRSRERVTGGVVRSGGCEKRARFSRLQRAWLKALSVVGTLSCADGNVHTRCSTARVALSLGEGEAAGRPRAPPIKFLRATSTHLLYPLVRRRCVRPASIACVRRATVAPTSNRQRRSTSATIYPTIRWWFHILQIPADVRSIFPFKTNFFYFYNPCIIYLFIQNVRVSCIDFSNNFTIIYKCLIIL